MYIYDVYVYVCMDLHYIMYIIIKGIPLERTVS